MSGAVQPGDVLVIFGATLVVWVVAEEWVEVRGLTSFPSTVPDRFLIGGPSNAGALFVDWARTLTGGARRRAGARGGAGPVPVPECVPGIPPGPGLASLPAGGAHAVPRPGCRPACTGWTSPTAPTPWSAPRTRPAASSSAGWWSGRVCGPDASWPPAGDRARSPWMQAVADATGLPVDTVAVPEGAALGAAFLARLVSGLESDFQASGAWARTGRRIEPDPAWAAAADGRFLRFEALGPGADVTG